MHHSTVFNSNNKSARKRCACVVRVILSLLAGLRMAVFSVNLIWIWIVKNAVHIQYIRFFFSDLELEVNTVHNGFST